jgi:general secretion pathway protein A
MYEAFYGLRDLPFEPTPNPRYLYLTRHHREGLSNLTYGLSSAKALTLLIGEVGTGKTTLLRAALMSEACGHVRCMSIDNPTLTRAEFLATLAARFDLGPEAAGSKAILLDRLRDALCARRARGEITALVVDEAQTLSTELLEEIRLLANMETADEKLLPLVLTGQPELASRLEESGLRQLKQRVTLRCEITPFTLTDTAACIAHRVKTAGGAPARLFTQEAVRLIHACARGIPRTVCVLCDNALVTGFALNRQRVDHAIVEDVARDFRFTRHAPGDPQAPVAPGHSGPIAADGLADATGTTHSMGFAPAPQSRGFGIFR